MALFLTAPSAKNGLEKIMVSALTCQPSSMVGI